ncbi:MAG: FHA domain-containing protein [Peptoniphilaceae bacterium]|nr:FHA domain-containing protein [Peptoniphilaceae bacterium]MDY6018025.1 FHA domain-containing protein [Anaerococcus sp.]
MEQFFNFIDSFFSIKVFGNLTLYQLLSTILKYLFVIIVLYFIYSIIRIIYYDVRASMKKEKISDTYLKLLNFNQGFKFKVQEYYIIGENNTIGREKSNTISINDKFMSKFHARIIYDEGVYFLEDLDSANGTYLNNEKIEDAIELKSNDIIKMGQVQFLFVDGDENAN